MNRKIENILLAIPLLLMAACAADDSSMASGGRKGEERKIRLTASVSAPVNNTGSMTRAWADQYNDRLPSGAAVYVYLYAYSDANASAIDVANYVFKDKMGASWTSAWVYETQGEVDVASGRSPLAQTYPTATETTSNDAEDAQPVFPASLGDEGYVDAIAVFLPDGSESNHSVSGGTLTFTAPANQTTQAAVVSADLLTNEVSATMKSSASAINLDMRHRMSKVLVQFTPAEDLTAENMPNDTYLMENVKTQLAVTLLSGAVATTGSTGTVTAKVGEPFFIAPQTITAGTELLKFDLRNVGGTATGIKNVTLTPTSNIEFREGVFYTLNVTVGLRYINLTTTIRNWTGETVTFDKKLL